MHKCVEHSGVIIRGQEDTIPALEEAALLKGLELSHNFDGQRGSAVGTCLQGEGRQPCRQETQGWGTQRRRRVVNYGYSWRLGWPQLMNDPECSLGKPGLSLWATGSHRRFKRPGNETGASELSLGAYRE